ncbi:MAG TPA: uroporphyrinogen-III synthase [Aquabacterium sp.]|nr:uroporphyrinogen-III synthase [Aquabacterium sp.]HQC95612.1 uroporphyrinogen-III synthase [Aquabacterium sp.]
MTAQPHLIVTRPQPQADAWVARLQALGLAAGALPLLGIDAPADAAPVHAAWQAIVRGQDAAGRPLAVVMFVSPSAVQRFFAQRPVGLAWPADVLAAAPGQGTRDALAQAGVPALALCSPPAEGGRFDSEALWAVLHARCHWPGHAALVVRGEDGRNWLAEALRQQGAAVHFVEAYRRTAPVPTTAQQALLAQALARPAAFCWLFSSSEAVGQLPTLAPGADWSAAQALATHPRIAAAAQALGMPPVPVIEPMPEAVAAWLGARSAHGPSIQSRRT